MTAAPPGRRRAASIRAVTDLRRLQYFVAVAQERNFTRAAERLHVAQPALSRQVRLLEQELGVELLHRTTHEFELTEAGEFLLERGPALLSAADELWRSVRTYGTGERGQVVVAYGASASYETAPRLLQALAESHPGIAITTAVKSVGEIVAGVTRRLDRPGARPLPSAEAGAGGADDPPRAPGSAVAPRPSARVRSRRRASSSWRTRRCCCIRRDANPGHYDAVLELCREQGFEPRRAGADADL